MHKVPQVQQVEEIWLLQIAAINQWGQVRIIFINLIKTSIKLLPACCGTSQFLHSRNELNGRESWELLEPLQDPAYLLALPGLRVGAGAVVVGVVLSLHQWVSLELCSDCRVSSDWVRPLQLQHSPPVTAGAGRSFADSPHYCTPLFTAYSSAQHSQHIRTEQLHHNLPAAQIRGWEQCLTRVQQSCPTDCSWWRCSLLLSSLNSSQAEHWNVGDAKYGPASDNLGHKA